MYIIFQVSSYLYMFDTKFYNCYSPAGSYAKYKHNSLHCVITCTAYIVLEPTMTSATEKVYRQSPLSTVYTLSNKNPLARNFLSPESEVTCGTVAIIIRVVLLSPYLHIRGVYLSSIHYNQSHRVYINRRQQYICLISN